MISLTLQGYKSGAGVAKSAMAVADVTTQARAFVVANATLLGVSAVPGDLIALSAEVDKLGLGHQRFALRYGSLPVYGGEVYVHVDGAAGVYYATTKPMGEPPASLVPFLTAEDARQAAINWAAADAPAGAMLEADPPKLVILPLRVAGQRSSNESRLAWHVRVATEDPMAFDEQCFVDAGNLEVLLHFSNIRGLDRKVWDCGAYPGYASCFIDAYTATYNYYFGRSESAPARGPYPKYIYPFYYGSVEVDTLHSLLATNQNYWLTTFGLDGASGQGGLGLGTSIPRTETWGFVHTDNSNPTLCPNWAWYSTSQGAVAFCRKMVTPDLLGHEYGHGVVDFMFTDTQGNPIGTTYQGETGALEESFADIGGEGVELAALGSHDWHFGIYNDVAPGTYPSSVGGLIRNLAEPTSVVDPDQNPPQTFPDRFYSTQVYCGSVDNYGVHHNSTVPTYAFYLLSDGGPFNGCTISPIGFDAALQVWYRAWSTYFTRTATFNEAYFALIQAAADLYPQEIVDQVRIALQAVEMDQPGLCSGIPAVTPACAGVTAVPDDLVSPAEGSSIQYCGPNPSFGQATIKYALARDGEVEIVVYDISGRQVAMVLRERQERGLHHATWTGRRAASGVYFVRVSVGGVTIGTGKLMVVR